MSMQAIFGCSRPGVGTVIYHLMWYKFLVKVPISLIQNFILWHWYEAERIQQIQSQTLHLSFTLNHTWFLQLVHWEDRQTIQRLRSYSIQTQVAKCIPFLSENSVSNPACCKLHPLIAVLPFHSFPPFCLTGQWCCGPFFSFGHSDTKFSLLFPRLIHSSLQSLFFSLPFIINSLRFHCFCLPTMLISHSLCFPLMVRFTDGPQKTWKENIRRGIPNNFP